DLSWCHFPYLVSRPSVPGTADDKASYTRSGGGEIIELAYGLTPAALRHKEERHPFFAKRQEIVADLLLEIPGSEDEGKESFVTLWLPSGFRSVEVIAAARRVLAAYGMIWGTDVRGTVSVTALDLFPVPGVSKEDALRDNLR